MHNSKKRKTHFKLDGVLKKIYATEVALEPNHHCKKDVLMAFLANFEEFSKHRSPEFSEMFQGFYHTGSYFEGLRVKMATEFDINVQLSLKLDSVDYLINELEHPLSYATYKLNSSSYQKFSHGKIKSFFDSEHYLIGQNVLKWFQSLVDSFVCNAAAFAYPGVIEVKTTNSGPARTVKVLFGTDWISIDLVPVFTLSCDYLYKYTFPSTMKDRNAYTSCFLVPKPLHPNLIPTVDPKMVDRVWRINFTRAEKDILDSKPELKPAIQILKALRDKEDWPLPSYFLKIIGLHIIISNSIETKVKLDHIFLELLESLKSSLDCRFLGHLFYRSFNLFHTLKYQTLRDVSRRVQFIIQKLRKRPDNAYQFFQVLQFFPIENVLDDIETEYHALPPESTLHNTHVGEIKSRPLPDSILHSTFVDGIKSIPKKARQSVKVEKCSNKHQRRTKSRRGFQGKNTCLSPNHQNDPEMNLDWDSGMQIESLPANNVENEMLPTNLCSRNMRNQKNAGNRFPKFSNACQLFGSSPEESNFINIQGKDNNHTLPRKKFCSKSVVGEILNPKRAIGVEKRKKHPVNGKQMKSKQHFQLRNTCSSSTFQNYLEMDLNSDIDMQIESVPASSSTFRSYPEMDLNRDIEMQIESVPANEFENKLLQRNVYSKNMRNEKNTDKELLKFNNADPLHCPSPVESPPMHFKGKDNDQTELAGLSSFYAAEKTSRKKRPLRNIILSISSILSSFF